MTEIIRLNHYYEKEYRLRYLRTKDNAEIDLIVERPAYLMLLLKLNPKDTLMKEILKHWNVFFRILKTLKPISFPMTQTKIK